jgi:hypothetical protein
MAQSGSATADFMSEWLLSIPAHNELVANKVNQYIQTAFQSRVKAGGSPTIVEVLEAAQDLAEKGRKGPHDEIGRDAEYYLKCRWQVAKRDTVLAKQVVALGGTGLNLLYNGLKAAAIGLNFEPIMRTDSNVPVSPPGGILWGIRGADDGIKDEGLLQGMPKLITRDIRTSPASQ